MKELPGAFPLRKLIQFFLEQRLDIFVQTLRQDVFRLHALPLKFLDNRPSEGPNLRIIRRLLELAAGPLREGLVRRAEGAGAAFDEEGVWRGVSEKGREGGFVGLCFP